jgi:hypothetical protein
LLWVDILVLITEWYSCTPFEYSEVDPFSHSAPVLILRCFLLLGFEGLLAIALDHDDREEAADDGGAQDDENDRDADGPDAWEEERVEDVVIVDEWLHMSVVGHKKNHTSPQRRHTRGGGVVP